VPEFSLFLVAFTASLGGQIEAKSVLNENSQLLTRIRLPPASPPSPCPRLLRRVCRKSLKHIKLDD